VQGNQSINQSFHFQSKLINEKKTISQLTKLNISFSIIGSKFENKAVILCIRVFKPVLQFSQLTNHPFNQLNNHPINQLNNHPINQITHQSINQSTNKSGNLFF